MTSARGRHLEVEIHATAVRDIDTDAFSDPRACHVDDEDLRHEDGQPQQLDASPRPVRLRPGAENRTRLVHVLAGVVDSQHPRGQRRDGSAEIQFVEVQTKPRLAKE